MFFFFSLHHNVMWMWMCQSRRRDWLTSLAPVKPRKPRKPLLAAPEMLVGLSPSLDPQHGQWTFVVSHNGFRGTYGGEQGTGLPSNPSTLPSAGWDMPPPSNFVPLTNCHSFAYTHPSGDTTDVH